MKGKKKERSQLLDKILRMFLIAIGTFFVSLGFIGIFIPLLPTTPFLLLAAACYARGSKKFYNWLLNNKWFGTHIKNYRENKGISIRAKIVAITLLWVTISISIFVIDIFFARLILVLVAIGVTIHLLSIRTLRSNQ